MVELIPKKERIKKKAYNNGRLTKYTNVDPRLPSK
jgi:hypothetical protein